MNFLLLQNKQDLLRNLFKHISFFIKMSDYVYSEKRKKGKDKRKNRKKYPYKKGGKQRTIVLGKEKGKK